MIIFLFGKELKNIRTAFIMVEYPGCDLDRTRTFFCYVHWNKNGRLGLYQYTSTDVMRIF